MSKLCKEHVLKCTAQGIGKIKYHNSDIVHALRKASMSVYNKSAINSPMQRHINHRPPLAHTIEARVMANDHDPKHK